MIDKLEKDVQELYEHFNKMDFRKTSEEERWEVRLGAGASQYINGPTLYGFLLGQWAAYKSILYQIAVMKDVRMMKLKADAIVYGNEEDDE